MEIQTGIAEIKLDQLSCFRNPSSIDGVILEPMPSCVKRWQEKGIGGDKRVRWQKVGIGSDRKEGLISD